MKIIFILSAFALISCGQASDTTTATAHEPLPDSAVVQSLKDAWLYGFPLVVMHATRQVMTNVTVPFNKGRLLAPVNQLVSASRFPDAKFRDVVRPNCDTYYSVAWMDLGKEPMVLHLPDTHDRYDLFPLLDAWTNVFFCPGKRTTGTKAQTYLITAPGWEGQIPDNMQQVKSPTRMIWMIGRIQVNSAADGNTVVKKIQEGCYLVPLSAYGKPYTAPLGKRDSTLKAKAPNEIVLEMNAADYFNLLNKLLKENPPAAADSVMMYKLAALGIGAGKHFDATEFPPGIQDSLKALPAWGKNFLSRSRVSGRQYINGWSVSRGLGKYGTRYDFRAGTAYSGLGANLDADAMYPGSMTDGDGQPYDGSKNNYVLHFEAGKLPPARAFWSLTLYSNEGFLCANAINRFAIGDRNALKKNADGSMDIYIGKNRPGESKESNWLPAPEGPFNLLLRIYWPKAEMVSGDWQVPPVKKTTRGV